jgi:histone H3/H4
MSFMHEGTQHAVSDLYQSGVTPADVVRELGMFSENDIPIIVIDEYNLVKDSATSRLMAETIKAVSDASLKATIVIVGISDSVSDLIAGHESIGRCSEEVLMPRMTNEEMKDVLERRVKRLGLNIEGDAKWKIINLSKGLPAFAHGLGKGAVMSAISNRRKTVRESDVDSAIDEVLNSSWNTLKSEYEVATHSNQEKARYKQILTACALAQSDEVGYFIPKEVQGPLSIILRRQVGIDGFNDNLKDFTEPKRGRVLQRKGQARIYRYRFRNPAMQPYVIMKGIQDGLLDESARSALSAPEQPSLFPTDVLRPSGQ